MSECKICGTRKGDMICQDCVDDNSAGHFEEARLRAEVERLTAMLPPACREAGGPFAGQGDWSVYAERVAQERDDARAEVEAMGVEKRILQDEVLRLRAEVERLTAAPSDESRAVERLANEMTDCPPIPHDACTFGEEGFTSCVDCRMAWARQKEVGK